MTITISAAHNNARLLGTLSNLDTGAGKATIQIWDGTRPAVGGATPGTGSAKLLVTIQLEKPSATLAANQLQLIALAASVAAGGDLIAQSGIAAWARFINGNGDWSMDTDVSASGGTGEVQLPGLQLYAGGTCPLVSTSAIS